MNFEQPVSQENLLESKLNEVKKLKYQMDSAKNLKEYNDIGNKIEVLYTENNNELLDYEKEKNGK